MWVCVGVCVCVCVGVYGCVCMVVSVCVLCVCVCHDTVVAARHTHRVGHDRIYLGLARTVYIHRI